MNGPSDLKEQLRPFQAVDRGLDTAAALTRTGEPRRAAAALARAISALEDLPAGHAKRYLQARSLLERARLKWLGAGLEASFSLDEALQDALRAETLFGEDPSPAVAADTVATIAGIAYDIGDPPALAIAEAELDCAIDALSTAGVPALAAKLLNEQAAVQLRLGHAVKTAELLTRSEALLEPCVASSQLDVRARGLLADTRHLKARLALHSTGNLDEEAIAAAIAHATMAEETYRRIGLRRELARVWETVARLEARRGHMDDARVALIAAIAIEDDILDLVGLARSTEGLAEILAEIDPAGALDMIATSIELNREKHSAAGIAFDQRTFAAIERIVAATPVATEAIRGAVARTKKMLAEPRPRVEASSLARA